MSVGYLRPGRTQLTEIKTNVENRDMKSGAGYETAAVIALSISSSLICT